MKRLFLILFFALASCTTAQNSFRLTFTPESEKFSQATQEYQDIWNGEGEKITKAMEQTTGIKFKRKEIKVVVYEGVSNAGLGDAPIMMRASYPPEVKKATLIHELGHKLLADIPNQGDIDEHRALFLVLYDIWEQLYGKEFADRAVTVEKQRKGIYDYESAWNWSLSMSKEERAGKFAVLRESLK